MLLSLERCIIEFLSAFDGRTTALLVALAFFIQANVIGAQAFLIREYKGVGMALLGNLSMAIGFSLLLLRNILPDFITIIIANSLILISPNLYYIAVSKFSGQKHSPALSILIVLINAFLLIFFTYTSENVNARITTISILGALSTLLAVKQLWNLRPAIYKFSVALMAIPLGIYCVFLIVRAIFSFFQPPTAIFSNTPIETATYILLFIISFLWTIGFILMVSQRLQADLTELATIDTLTRIPNRHAAQTFFGREFSRKDRHGDDFSILLIDLDNFKQVNDRYGHALGDFVLVKTADMFQAALRKQDLVSRWGGEEFLIILPKASIQNAQLLAERLRTEISNTEFKDANISVNLTISTGIAHSDQADTMDTLLKKADDALYVAKATKNAVMVAK